MLKSNAEEIHIKGAREHNLNDIEISIPRNKLVVITGVSGSGKSSLAFDTLYAEGYRKYMDSLSIRARRMLEQVRRPDVDFIHGLSPVIAIEQRGSSGGNPRSTVATVTEIADYAQLLWTLCGEQYCPVDGGQIERRSIDDCITRIYQEKEGSRLVLLAPLPAARTSVLREELLTLRQRGFKRVRIDNQIRELDEPDIIKNGQEEMQIDLVVDRLILKKEQRSRIADSLELAFHEGGDRAIILYQEDKETDWIEFVVSQKWASNIGGTVYEPLTPRHLSYNHHEGACETCGGLGFTLQFRDELLIPDPTLPVKRGAIKPWRIGSKSMIIRRNAILRQLAEQLPFNPETPWDELSQEVRSQILHGAGERLFTFKLSRGKKVELMPFEGVVADLEKTRRDTSSDGLRARLMAYQTSSKCKICDGKRLNARAEGVKLNRISISTFMKYSIRDALDFCNELKKHKKRYEHATDAVLGLNRQLYFLNEVGLGYLTLDRTYGTLSGGESQRARLATQLGMSLVGIAYVLDEPSIGLHPMDHAKLISALIELRERGNAVIVVEHDEGTMRMADYIIELGPGAGISGGEIIFAGTAEESMQCQESRTGQYLSGKAMICRNAKEKRPANKWIKIKKASEHNLKDVDIDFPVGLLTVVCGVSGSGKSTLVNGILANAATWKLNRAKTLPGNHAGIDGLEYFRKAVRVDQDPIGRSPRSNPATYIKLFDVLRQLFAKCSLAKIRGYKASRFSFNMRGGRCERCQGDGQIKLDMQFLDDVYAECPSCNGKRYNRETLEVRFKGFNIADVLDMTVTEASQLFRKQPKIISKLDTLSAVGLDYIKLGQSSNTLSGGEAQRIKLALELSKRQQGETMYILDEPTTGLHWDDIQKLIDLLFKLRDAGNTIIVIEHHMDVIRLADWVVELGPGGGEDGGELIYSGNVAGIKSATTPTGKCLRKSDDANTVRAKGLS